MRNNQVNSDALPNFSCQMLLNPVRAWNNDRNAPVARPTSGTIPVAGPWITEREVEAVAARRPELVVRRTPASRAGRSRPSSPPPTGRRHAIALPSCTAGLHLSLHGARRRAGRRGDRARDDMDRDRRADRLRRRHADLRRRRARHVVHVGRVGPSAAHPRTKAVIAVDLYGGFPDLVALEALVRRARHRAHRGRRRGGGRPARRARRRARSAPSRRSASTARRR